MPEANDLSKFDFIDIQDVMVVKYDSSIDFFVFKLTWFSGYSVLSPIVFTNTLLPLLKDTAKLEGSDVRIVNVRRSLYHDTTPRTHPHCYRLVQMQFR